MIRAPDRRHASCMSQSASIHPYRRDSTANRPADLIRGTLAVSSTKGVDLTHLLNVQTLPHPAAALPALRGSQIA